MPIVPFNSGAAQPTAADKIKAALPEQWALMAAAQMHSEGRLVAKEPTDERAHSAPRDR